LSFSISRVTW